MLPLSLPPCPGSIQILSLPSSASLGSGSGKAQEPMGVAIVPYFPVVLLVRRIIFRRNRSGRLQINHGNGICFWRFFGLWRGNQNRARCSLVIYREMQCVCKIDQLKIVIARHVICRQRSRRIIDVGFFQRTALRLHSRWE